MLGAAGALIADPFMRTLGLASWGLPVWLLVWALRLISHSGDHRIWSRLIIAPIAIVIGAVFASAHAPMEAWTLATGLGGMIGDAILSILLGGGSHGRRRYLQIGHIGPRICNPAVCWAGSWR